MTDTRGTKRAGGTPDAEPEAGDTKRVRPLEPIRLDELSGDELAVALSRAEDADLVTLSRAGSSALRRELASAELWRTRLAPRYAAHLASDLQTWMYIMTDLTEFSRRPECMGGGPVVEAAWSAYFYYAQLRGEISYANCADGTLGDFLCVAIDVCNPEMLRFVLHYEDDNGVQLRATRLPKTWWGEVRGPSSDICLFNNRTVSDYGNGYSARPGYDKRLRRLMWEWMEYTDPVTEEFIPVSIQTADCAMRLLPRMFPDNHVLCARDQNDCNLLASMVVENEQQRTIVMCNLLLGQDGCTASTVRRLLAVTGRHGQRFDLSAEIDKVLRKGTSKKVLFAECVLLDGVSQFLCEYNQVLCERPFPMNDIFTIGLGWAIECMHRGNFIDNGSTRLTNIKDITASVTRYLRWFHPTTGAPIALEDNEVIAQWFELVMRKLCAASGQDDIQTRCAMHDLLDGLVHNEALRFKTLTDDERAAALAVPSVLERLFVAGMEMRRECASDVHCRGDYIERYVTELYAIMPRLPPCPPSVFALDWQVFARNLPTIHEYSSNSLRYWYTVFKVRTTGGALHDAAKWIAGNAELYLSAVPLVQCGQGALRLVPLFELQDFMYVWVSEHMINRPVRELWHLAAALCGPDGPAHLRDPDEARRYRAREADAEYAERRAAAYRREADERARQQCRP